jgi:diguanylate cyclase (GGDEF)-like protein/PAS domain S-box-containing protein
VTAGDRATTEVAYAESLRRLHALVRSMNGDLDLGRTLEAVTAGVVDEMGFAVTVVNLVQPDGDFEVVAVAGPEDARATLLGKRGSGEEWARWLAECTPVGSVLVDYRHVADVSSVPTWVPDAPVRDDEGAWHPLDAVVAPLRTSRSGLLGTLSVDLPRDGLRPNAAQLELLEMYAAQASIAIENAMLHTALVERDAERERTVGRLTALVAEAPVAIIELDLEGRVRLWNPAAEEMFGWTAEEVLGGPNPTVPADRYPQRMRELARGDVARRRASRRQRKDGSFVELETSSAVLRDTDGEPFGYIGVLADVSHRVQLEEELRHGAHHDPLTGLANRALMLEHLQEAVGGQEHALLLIDLDGFKAVNDSFGHETGDLVLRRVAARLRAGVRPGDLVARLGGDEFVVLVHGGEERALPLAHRLLDVLSEPMNLDGRQVTLGCSIGVAYLDGERDADAVLGDADIAMYAAKGRGKACVQVFAPPLRHAVVERAALAADLRRAVSARQLHLRYHPILHLETGAVLGFEALLRWQHPERGEIGPQAFIPLAEENGTIVGIGEWVVREACEQLARWQHELPGAPRLSMSINVSPVQLRSPALVRSIAEALEASGISPRRLVVELTESVLVEDVETAAAVLEQLRGLGVRVALDDFGAGYSSLRYLRRLPFDFVKLDRGLVEGIDRDPAALALADAALSLLARLGLRTCAEGIETAGQLAAVRSLGCELGQGFLVCQPLLPHEVPELLARRWDAVDVPAPRSDPARTARPA